MEKIHYFCVVYGYLRLRRVGTWEKLIIKRKPNITMKIDVEQVLASKAPKLAKRLPRFLIRYLKKIIHQEEINQILEKYGDLNHIEFIRTGLGEMGVTWKIEGMERIPKEGRYLFTSNHPFGGMDGLILAQAIDKHFGKDVRSISNDLLLFVEPLRPMFLPVNKHGRQSREAVHIFEDTFASEIPIQTFPAGLCSRRIKGEVTDLEWRPSFAKKAVQHQRDVVPVYVEGKLSNRFYNIANFRKFFGIKANIEMLFLVDEMFLQKGKHIVLHIGEPIPWQTLAEMSSPSEMTDYVRSKVYAMAPKKER